MRSRYKCGLCVSHFVRDASGLRDVGFSDRTESVSRKRGRGLDLAAGLFIEPLQRPFSPFLPCCREVGAYEG